MATFQQVDKMYLYNNWKISNPQLANNAGFKGCNFRKVQHIV